jgi:hypothetical protein
MWHLPLQKGLHLAGEHLGAVCALDAQHPLLAHLPLGSPLDGSTGKMYLACEGEMCFLHK